MTDTITEVEVELSTDEGDDDLAHVYCPGCDPKGNVAFCGADLTGAQEVGWSDVVDDADLCIVCDELSDHPCAKCGYFYGGN